MKKRWTKLVTLLTAAVLAMGCLTACGGNDTGNDTGSDTQQEQALSGSITLSGSTSMDKVAKALQEGFMEKNPNVTVNVEFNGSSAGIEQVLKGSVNIGNASRNLKESEVNEGAVENIVAIDGIAVVVDKANTVTDITTEELIKIYKGEIKNWSELGGTDSPIVVIGREAGSGTRGAFEELLEIEDACAYAQELDSTGTVLANVAATPGAIGYVSLDVINDTVATVKLDGVEATAENIAGGSYSLSRPFVMATKGEISRQDELTQAFFAYVASEEGQAIIEQVGLILPQ
uniref:phosphate ABC transporter substrate-binding protein n=1 Tax=Agathobacter sp. TaxID=2021311 RepID=UPI004055EBD4